MATATAVRKMTFEEFTRLNSNERLELVDGRLETLMASMPKHGWSSNKIGGRLDVYLEEYDPEGFWGSEIDIPTIPFHARRPDFVYYNAEATATGIDLDGNRVLGIPTLVVEVISPGDESRDEIVKRKEYARAGIPHYWLLNPIRKTAVTLRLVDGEYVEAARFRSPDDLISPLFPGFSIPLPRLFRG